MFETFVTGLQGCFWIHLSFVEHWFGSIPFAFAKTISLFSSDELIICCLESMGTSEPICVYTYI